MLLCPYTIHIDKEGIFLNNTFDILIIGGGAVGCAVARELSRYRLSVALLEKEWDVAAGTSGRNSAVVHAGFNNKPGSLMAQLCVAVSYTHLTLPTTGVV